MTLSTTSMPPKHIYVAGPISRDPMAGTRAAVLAGAELMRGGLVPFVPHLSVLWQMIDPVEYEDWMIQDFAWIRRCDALLRLPGESPGADREVAFAKQGGLPIFTRATDAVAWAKGTPA